jgi:hypothetical protein
MNGVITRIAVLGLFVCIVVFAAHQNTAQREVSVAAASKNQEKVVVKGRDRNVPVKILTVRVKGRPVQSNKPFIDDENWLRDLDVRVANTSGKTITYLEVMLIFRDPENKQRPAAWTLRHGVNPVRYITPEEMPSPKRSIRPGDILELRLPSEQEGAFTNFLLDSNYLGANKVEVITTAIAFSDGKVWTGQMMKRDGNGRWTRDEPPAKQARIKAPAGRASNLAHAPKPPQGLCSQIFMTFDQCEGFPAGCTYPFWHFVSPPVSGDWSTEGGNVPCQRDAPNFIHCDNVLSAIPRDCCPDYTICNEDPPRIIAANSCYGCEEGYTQAIACCYKNCDPNCGVCIDGLCYDESPIIVDILGDGFKLSNLETGVGFDLNADGAAEQISWTYAETDDAWLVLDRNGNGTIDTGAELFGNFTPQPAPPTGEGKNGFLALAVFDKTENGGNNNKQIDAGDSVFASLRLWRDTNHNGISETSELNTLNELGLRAMDLTYRVSKKTDEYGNQYRYRAKAHDVEKGKVGRWAWDVILLTPHP